VALEIDPGKTALVLIDLQAGILANTLAPYDSETVVANGLTLARAVKAAGGVVVAVNVSFGPDRVNGPQGLTDVAPPTGAVQADYAEIVPELMVLKDILITKRQWGALHGTELDTLLRRRGIDTIIVGGVATNFGVETTVREGWSHGYSVIVAEDASTTFSAAMQDFPMTLVFPRIARCGRWLRSSRRWEDDLAVVQGLRRPGDGHHLRKSLNAGRVGVLGRVRPATMDEQGLWDIVVGRVRRHPFLHRR
jgi:nicotinamidase-related amidase